MLQCECDAGAGNKLVSYLRRSCATPLTRGNLPVSCNARDGACFARSARACRPQRKAHAILSPFACPFRGCECCFQVCRPEKPECSREAFVLVRISWISRNVDKRAEVKPFPGYGGLRNWQLNAAKALGKAVACPHESVNRHAAVNVVDPLDAVVHII